MTDRSINSAPLRSIGPSRGCVQTTVGTIDKFIASGMTGATTDLYVTFDETIERTTVRSAGYSTSTGAVDIASRE